MRWLSLVAVASCYCVETPVLKMIFVTIPFVIVNTLEPFVKQFLTLHSSTLPYILKVGYVLRMPSELLLAADVALSNATRYSHPPTVSEM